MAEAYRFEFDPENKILLMRFEESRITNELLGEVHRATGKYAIATDAYAVIADYSSVIQVEVSAGFIRQIALEEPTIPRAGERGRVVVARDDVVFGLVRIFQMVGEPKRPLFLVVRTLAEAFEALGVACPQFERMP
jgi:hypothetical protein